MALPFFYHDTDGANGVVTLGEDTSKHIVQVLRMQKGAPLLLTNGKGLLMNAVIADDHRKRCTLTITQKQQTAQAGRRVCVAISLLKNASRFEWFLEKATELGVTEIMPLRCDRTEKQHFRYERMQGILVAAMLQSQQAWLPVLHPLTVLADGLRQLQAPVKLVAHCDSGSKQNITAFAAEHEPAAVLIGPEGDFTPAEIDAALRAGFTPVALGNTRLRTETAGVAAAVVLCLGH